MDRRIGEWQLISNLGEGTFGVVSLWRNLNNYKSIGERIRVLFEINRVPR